MPHMKKLLIACALAALAACAKKPAIQVLESYDENGVTYLRVKTADGERWLAATPVAGPKKKEIGDVKVPKAEGADAKTIAEIWASKAALKDRRVVVHAKVVKFLPSIMGKNWLHVRDGSGSHGKGDDDIAVISDDKATVGSVVTLTGTVRLDKDFGAGYSYPVIIEEAKLK